MAFNVYEVLNFVDVKKCILNNIRASDKIIHVFCDFHKNFSRSHATPSFYTNILKL